jgi:hypothetical protein
MVNARTRLIILWQESINPVDLVVSDAAQGIGEPGLRIDAVQLGGGKIKRVVFEVVP